MSLNGWHDAIDDLDRVLPSHGSVITIRSNAPARQSTDNLLPDNSSNTSMSATNDSTTDLSTSNSKNAILNSSALNSNDNLSPLST